MTNSTRDWRQAFTWTLFTGLALMLCLHLSVHWIGNPQYSFGVLVPVLAGWTLYRRWIIRPAPVRPAGSWAWASIPLAIAALPLWLLAQPNPDWRLISWLLTADFIALGLVAWTAAGGLPWARHFAFPTCFIATAVPWPSAVELPVIQGLMLFVAGVSVALLNFAGIPALQLGNVIEIGTGLLGVDEACSGVRSLQAALMAAVFFGEFFWFSWPRRVLLIGAALAAAVATNAARALFLAWQASRHGLEAVERWHDPAGYGVMTACFLLLWGIAVSLQPGRSAPTLALGLPPARLLPRPILIALLSWFALVLVGTEWWFWSSGPPPGRQWTFRWPRERAEFQQVAIPPEVAAQLQYDYGEGATWKDEKGAQWLAYHFRWGAGPSRSRLLARMHRPENCLPATGWQLTRSAPELTVQTGPQLIPFQPLTFQQGSQTAHIWFCAWEDLPPTSRQRDDRSMSTQRAGLQAVLRRQRNLGQQVLQVVRFGELPAAGADTAFLKEAAPLLQTVEAR